MKHSLSIIFFICLVFNKPVFAESACQNPVFGKSGIAIDRTAATANEAQRLAMIDAHNAAFEDVLNRLLIEPLPQAFTIEPESLVELVHIRTENSLPGRYIAEIDICFSQDQMRALFAEAELGWAEVTSPLILVLPVFADGAGPRAWQVSHPWLSGWRAQSGNEEGLLRYTSLAQTLVNERQLRAEKLLKADKNVLQKAVSRAKAEQILWARALVSLKDGAPQLAMQALIFDKSGVVIASVADRVFTGATSSYRAEMDAFRQEVLATLETGWHKANLRKEGISNRLVVDITFANHEQWLAKRRILTQLPVISQLSTLLISAKDSETGGGRATVSLDMNGSIEAFRYALVSTGLSLRMADDKAVIE